MHSLACFYLSVYFTNKTSSKTYLKTFIKGLFYSKNVMFFLTSVAQNSCSLSSVTILITSSQCSVQVPFQRYKSQSCATIIKCCMKLGARIQYTCTCIYIEGFSFKILVLSFPLLDNYARSFRTFGPHHLSVNSN